MADLREPLLHTIATLSALLACAGCASAPPEAPPPEKRPITAASPLPDPVPRAERPAPAPDALSIERRLHEMDSEVVVFAATLDPSGVAAEGDEDRAPALSQLLVHALDVAEDLLPHGLAVDRDGHMQAPADLADSTARYFVGAHLKRLAPPGDETPLELTIWLMDRAAQRVTSRTVTLDLPLLIAPRNALADLMAETAHPPSELERADMTWYEDLDEARLALAGELVRALHRSAGLVSDQVDALVARADRLAPHSFVVASAVADHLVPRDPGCTKQTVDRLSHLLSLHREVPFTLESYVLSCALASELDPAAPEIPAWSKRSGSHCRIGAKGLTSVASSRLAGAAGRADGGPGFVTGLGGLYQGDTCDAGYAVMHHSNEALGPPLVRASLELEAAVYFYGARDPVKSRRWFERALATTATAATAATPIDPPCTLQLLGAEAELGLADLAVEAGREADARAHLAPARAVAERCHDWRMRGRILNSEALLEQNQSRFDKALELFLQALAAFERVADRVNVAVVETNLGVTWLQLGRVDRAVTLLESALAGKLKARSEGGVAVLLENLGVLELARGDPTAAASRFKDALDHTRDAHTVATLEVQLARIALARGDAADADAHLESAKESARRTRGKALEAILAQTEAAVALAQGGHTVALARLHEALALRRELGDRAGEGVTLSLLMSLSARMKRPSIAILYGKLAIAAHQEVRASAGAVDHETARDFLATRAGTYRQLADLLVSEGRLIEAERVLGLLKEDELSRWTRDAAATTSQEGVPLTVAEKRIDQRYQEIADKVMQLGREHGELAAKWPRSAAEEARLDKLRASMETANRRFSDFLATIADQRASLARSRHLTDLKEGTSIGPDLAELGPRFAAVYTLVSDDALHLIVVSPDAQVARSVTVARGVLNGVIAAFREALQDPARDPRAAARALYDYLVAPIEMDLEQIGAETILWSLDGALRYVPIGALYDGRRYVVERWGVAVFTPASKARMKDSPRPDWRVLALGVTAAHPPFPPLPAVGAELAGVVADDGGGDAPARGVLPGIGALDAEFTKDFFLSQLTRRWPVVHLASHFSFQPGDKDQSFLLLGDGSKLSVGELERLPNVFQSVDLLTLSACNTGTGDLGGDGTEVESFAVLAQRKGARAVFASLWPVVDTSTSTLMRRFYALHGEAPSKLEALRRAQLELIEAKVVPPPGTTRSKPLTLPGAPPTSAPPSDEPADPALAGWRHPYYWAPFILIGNVL